MQLSMTPSAHLEPEYTIRPRGATRPETDLSASEPGVILTVLGSDHHVNPVEQGLSGQYLECSSSIHPFRYTE